MEIYDEKGAWLSEWPDELEEWEPFEDPKVGMFFERYRAEVVPLVERIKAEVFA